ncbi:hypothetical protein SAY86_001755 [Trapa natans]|uniref:Protein TIFY n=1 Tax=Trapa natans TaxID=22666 RepID=A0AAN7LEW0_TRANT|nr:hypothetical protein SAY86_001755 [Trapa natans]
MSRAAVELDFFGLKKEKSSSSSSLSVYTSLDRRRTIRGIQSAISRISPELLKSVIASNTVPSPEVDYHASPPLPVYVPFPRTVAEFDGKETAPLTIFYSGAVTVFNVSHENAENILKLAVEASSKIAKPENKFVSAPPSSQQKLLGTLGGDLPLFRRKSLETFLEKRKERLTPLSPLACDDLAVPDFPEEQKVKKKKISPAEKV